MYRSERWPDTSFTLIHLFVLVWNVAGQAPTSACRYHFGMPIHCENEKSVTKSMPEYHDCVIITWSGPRYSRDTVLWVVLVAIVPLWTWWCNFDYCLSSSVRLFKFVGRIFASIYCIYHLIICFLWWPSYRSAIGLNIYVKDGVGNSKSIPLWLEL